MQNNWRVGCMVFFTFQIIAIKYKRIMNLLVLVVDYKQKPVLQDDLH